MSGLSNHQGRRTTSVAAGFALPPAGQAALAFLLAGLFYVSLYGQLPYHDAARFAAQINSGHFYWDIGHIFLQPATLLWHRYLGFGESAIQSQKHISTFATALAIGLFYYTLTRLDITVWRRILASALLASACSIVTLAPSAHMKLVAFPFVNLALLCLVTWERVDHGDTRMPLVIGGASLGVAGAFLASCLATVPFATLAVCLVSYRRTGSWKAALGNGVLFGGVCTIAFGGCLVTGYLAFSGLPFGLAGVRQSIDAKADLRPATSEITLSLSGLARLAYGTVNNFVAAPHLGPDMRAYMAHRFHHLGPYRPILIAEAPAVLATVALLALIYVRAAIAFVRGQAVVTIIAFLCGAQAWSIYYGLNDPEHWFQLAAPTIILFLLTVPGGIVRWVLLPWFAGTLAANLMLYAIPQATYPLHRYEAQLQRQYSSNDLLVHFVTYPGTHYLGFFDLGDIPNLSIDQMLKQSHDPQRTFAELRNRINATLDAGGKVVVFNVLNPQNWSGGWAVLSGMKISKAYVSDFFHRNFKVTYLGQIAEMPAWRIQKLPDPNTAQP